MKRWYCLLLMATAAVAAPSDDPDAAFYAKSLQSGLAEIDAGLLAQQHGKNPSVVSFGSMMVKDHTAANFKLREAATANQVDLPTTMNAQQAAKKNELNGLTGDDFDRSYIESQILAHRDAIALFKLESESGDDKDARQFAIDTLPTLQAHLKLLLAMPMIPPATATAPP